MKAVILCVVLFLTAAWLPCEEYEAVSYSLEEFKKFSDAGDPGGIYFWDEFPALRPFYDLTEAESLLLGSWVGFDTYINSRNTEFSFFPNKFFLVRFNPRNFNYARGSSTGGRHFYQALGVWEIRGDVLVARIYSFIIRPHSSETDSTEKMVLFVEPYEIEIIDMRFIDPIGYSKIPFNRFRFPRELEDAVRASEGSQYNDRRMRFLYSWDYLNNNRCYWNFRIAPDLAKEGISGEDLARSPELINKYIWHL